MPPRKRAVSAATPDPDDTPEPVAEVDDNALEPSEPAPTDGAASKPGRSDLQAVDAPCPQCFPDGWGGPNIGARGCEHGTWQREATA